MSDMGIPYIMHVNVEVLPLSESCSKITCRFREHLPSKYELRNEDSQRVLGLRIHCNGSMLTL